LQKFIRVSISNQWPDDVKVIQLPNYLTGTAELWYVTWLDNRNKAAAATAAGVTAVGWDELTKALQKAFKNVAHQEVAEHKLLSRKQKIGESAEDYVYSMLDLIQDFDPCISETSKVRRIIKGLKPLHLENINPMQISTIKDVLDAIRKVAETEFFD